ncbi:MAG: choice-of-anchor L domain-containing protein, partial [Chitinophagales bacterium]
MKKIILLLATVVSSTLSFSQIEYTNAPPFDAEMFAERLAGYGVEIFNAELTCGDSSSGYFWNGGTTNLGMESGIVLTTGTTEIAFSPNTVGDASEIGGPGSYLLEDFLASNLICFVSTFNACILEFDFIAYGDEISLNYIFGSEEYPEYIGSSISDIFMILIEGLPQYPPEMSMMERNIGTIPSIPDIHVSINTLNFGTFPHFYQDNTGDEYIQYDGQTVRLPANATVTPGNTYHLTFVIADVADAIFDSGLFLEENSFQSNIPLLQSIRSNIDENSQRIAENCSEGILTFSLPFAPLYEEVWLPILTQVSDAPHMQMIFGGTATLQEDYTTDVSGISFSKREKDDLFPEIPTQEIRIIPVADNIEEETEYITVGLYSPYTESYLSMDTIWLEDEFNASIIEDVDICEANTEVSLWASGGTEYHWFPKDYLDCSDCPNPIATVPHSMTYFVNIEKMGCTEQELVNITIDENLNSAFLEEEVRVCSTESIELKASGGLYYEWEGVGAASTNELSCIDCPNPIFSPSTSMGDYIYSVRISSGEEGCEKVLTTNINVENTVLDLSVNQTSICSGETVVLTVVGNAENYLWQDGEGVIIAVSESIEVSPQTNETYIVSTQGTSCVISDSIHLEVCQLEAQIEVSDSFICKGESVLLNAIGTGEHTWLDSENNVIETGNELSVTPDMNTLYQLVAIQNGSIDTASTFISVEPTINLQVFPENPIICNSEERILLSIVSPIQGLTYEWEESEDLQVIWSNGQRAYASPNIDKTYTVQAISPAGCILSKEVTVSVGGELEITVDAPKVVCVDLDGSTLYTIRAYGANSYLWTPIGPLLPGPESYEAIFIPTAFNNDATFRVTGTNQDGTCTGFTEFEIEVVDKPEVLVDVTGICEGETTQIEVSVEGGSGSFEYEWYPVVGLSNPKGHITTAIIEEDGTSMYSLTIRDVELDYEWTEYVYANISKVKVLSPKFFKICGEEEELEFKVYGGYGATYTWMDANGNVFPNTNEELTVISPESGVYTVEVETSKGCNKSIDFEVEVLPNPSIEVIGLPDVVCSGEVFTLEVTGAEVYVLKSENNVPFDHQFISSNTIEVIVYEDTDLQITGISSFACEIDRTIHIDVLDIKVLTPFEVAICGEGDTAVLEVDGGEEAI